MAETWQARLERPVPGPLLHVRIGEQVEHLKQEPTWRIGDRYAITLTKRLPCSNRRSITRSRPWRKPPSS